MTIQIESYPTQYNGIQFRSRLEAHWAAMFDLLGWPYIYEPVDMGGWSPDFLIPAATKLFVEIKPIIEFDMAIGTKLTTNLAGWINQTGANIGSRSIGGIEPILLGLSPLLPPDAKMQNSDWHLGWCAELVGGWKYENGEDTREREVDSKDFWWEEAIPGHWEHPRPGSKCGFCHSIGTYFDRIGGGYDGGHHGCGHLQPDDPLFAEIKQLWGKAGNLTQWKRRNGHG